MAVHCSNCGEELMGSVNRCWRCGKIYESTSEDAETPPIRRAPIDGPLDARPEPTAAVVVAQSSDDPSPSIRKGSPFAAEYSTSADRPAISTSTSALAPVYPRHAAALGGAIASVVLGVMSVTASIFLPFPMGSLTVAMLGTGMGVWGIYSKHRGLAILGILLCCIAIAVSGFQSAVDVYTRINGRSPFAPVIDDATLENSIEE